MKMTLRLLCVTLFSTILYVPTGAAQTSVKLGARDVVVWAPATNALAPMIIFSHGFTGCPTQSTYLTKALAEHGYWVFAPRHADGRCSAREGGLKPQVPFTSAELWSDSTYIDRRNDFRIIEEAIKADPRYRYRIDFTKVAYAGHSLGGYTVMGLAGAWPTWTGATKPKAVLALSPFAEPFLSKNTLRNIHVPIMYQGGTQDLGITPYITKPDGAYDQTHASKYLVVFDGARHLSWTDIRPEDHEAIIAYSIAFLDHYVRDLPASKELTSPGALTLLRYDSELGSKKIMKTKTP